MSDEPSTTQGATAQGLVIPADTQQKFAELIALIQGSESMNKEERQYWINILPIMTPDQIQNLQEILETEKKQLREIDEKYAAEIQQVGQKELVRQTDEERRKKREERQAGEAARRAEDASSEEELLKKINEA